MEFLPSPCLASSTGPNSLFSRVFLPPRDLFPNPYLSYFRAFPFLLSAFRAIAVVSIDSFLSPTDFVDFSVRGLVVFHSLSQDASLRATETQNGNDDPFRRPLPSFSLLLHSGVRRHFLSFPVFTRHISSSPGLTARWPRIPAPRFWIHPDHSSLYGDFEELSVFFSKSPFRICLADCAFDI